MNNDLGSAIYEGAFSVHANELNLKSDSKYFTRFAGLLTVGVTSISIGLSHFLSKTVL